MLQAMLDFEAALARAEARVRRDPGDAAASHHAGAARAEGFDIAELVRALAARRHARDSAGAHADRAGSRAGPGGRGFVHWGATSQDVTGYRAGAAAAADAAQVLASGPRARGRARCARLSDEHAGTVMLGRTLLQPAPPVTFGLKAAGWLRRGTPRLGARGVRFDEAALPAVRRRQRNAGRTRRPRAGGERSAGRGTRTCKCPDAPWHGHRDRLAALMAALTHLHREPRERWRSISRCSCSTKSARPPNRAAMGVADPPACRTSAIPPRACWRLAAAKRVPGLLADFVAGMVQEHERAVGGWQAEWATVYGDRASRPASRWRSMAEVAEGLTVDAARMRRNIESTSGAVFAERAVMLLAPELGRDAAQRAGGRRDSRNRLTARSTGTARPGGLSGQRRSVPPAAARRRGIIMPFADLARLPDLLPTGGLASRSRCWFWCIRSAPTTACGIRRCRRCCAIFRCDDDARRSRAGRPPPAGDASAPPGHGPPGAAQPGEGRHRGRSSDQRRQRRGWPVLRDDRIAE